MKQLILLLVLSFCFYHHPMQGEEAPHYGTAITEDAEGNTFIDVINDDGTVVQLSFNISGQLTKISYSDGTEEIIEYSADGKPCRVFYRDGSNIIIIKDTLGRTTEMHHFGPNGEYVGSQTATYNPFQITSFTDFDGNQISFVYNSEGQIEKIVQVPPKIDENDSKTTNDVATAEQPSSFSLKGISKALWLATISLKDATANMYEYATEVKNKLSFENSVKSHLDQLAIQVFGKSFLNFSGYFVHKQETGVYGNGEFSDNVRITFINGILNVRDDHFENLQLLSESHGGVNIHYIFHPTQGWTRDILMSLPIKFGYVSDQARQLATIWKKLIQEMGGAEAGGTILHYAHSIGAADSLAAGMMLSPEEQRMIRVVTIGSPTMIAQNGFQSVQNYASYRDGVAMIGIIGFFGAMINPGPDNNVYFLDATGGIYGGDHPLNTNTYTQLIQRLGRDFINVYAKDITKTES